MKIYVSFKITEQPAGGGNNFLKFLSLWLEQRGLLTQKIREANILLINSHHNVLKNLIIKFLFNNKIFVHRIDGKLSLHRTLKEWDEMVRLQNQTIANATIFQSNWSKLVWNPTLKPTNYRVILNQANTKVFNVVNPKVVTDPIIFAYFSFSQNKNKGIEYVEWLEKEQINMNIQMRIIGNESEHENNLVFNKVSQEAIARQLSCCHALFYPSLNDACSNVILEAMAMGLPVLALNSGGSAEIVQNAGVMFTKREEIPKAIEEIRKNYTWYSKNAIKITNELNSAEKYLEYFMELNSPQYIKVNSSKLKIIYTAIKIIFISFLLRLNTLKQII